VKPLMVAAATEATDDQLVAAAQQGSDAAFEVLFRRYRDRIAAYVRGIVSDHARAEDIVQDAFISALRSLRATDRAVVFKPWVYEIAKNACIDHGRFLAR
jgi:RNA polymerase sigma factor (sigma-70 family)